MLVLQPCYIAHARLASKFPELLACTVVKNVDMELLRGIVDIIRRQRRIAHQGQRFVISWNKYIYMRPYSFVAGHRNGLPPQRPHGLHVDILIPTYNESL